LEQRIVKLREQEELDSIRPVLNGDEIMEILHLKPSKQVGEAYKFLLDRRMELGVETKDEAKKALLEWRKLNE
jgi:poly(A) polymerase